jgi:hypothetical protein
MKPSACWMRSITASISQTRSTGERRPRNTSSLAGLAGG